MMPGSPRNSVSPVAAVWLVARLLGGQLATRGRLLAVAALGGGTALITWLLRRGASSDSDAAELAIGVVSNLGFVLVVPIIALVFASATFGDLRDDSTLVYLWLRPMDRLPVVLGAYLAAVGIGLPLAVFALGIAAVAGGLSGATIFASVLAAGLGVLAYSSLFVLLGLFIRNSIVWGLGYILVWEGLLAGLFGGVARTSVRGYLRSILANLADVDVGGALDVSTFAAVLAMAVASAVALAAATYRLNGMEID